jgi:hypothetical protein
MPSHGGTGTRNTLSISSSFITFDETDDFAAAAVSGDAVAVGHLLGQRDVDMVFLKQEDAAGVTR